MVRHVEDHVSKFSLVDQLSAFWALEVVFLFFGREPFVFVNCHVLALNFRGKYHIVFARGFARKCAKVAETKKLRMPRMPRSSKIPSKLSIQNA